MQLLLLVLKISQILKVAYVLLMTLSKQSHCQSVANLMMFGFVLVFIADICCVSTIATMTMCFVIICFNFPILPTILSYIMVAKGSPITNAHHRVLFSVFLYSFVNLLIIIKRPEPIRLCLKNFLADFNRNVFRVT